MANAVSKKSVANVFAGDNPAELARELERGVPAWGREEVGLVVTLSLSVQRVLEVAILLLFSAIAAISNYLGYPEHSFGAIA